MTCGMSMEMISWDHMAYWSAGMCQNTVLHLICCNFGNAHSSCWLCNSIWWMFAVTLDRRFQASPNSFHRAHLQNSNEVWIKWINFMEIQPCNFFHWRFSNACRLMMYAYFTSKLCLLAVKNSLLLFFTGTLQQVEHLPIVPKFSDLVLPAAYFDGWAICMSKRPRYSYPLLTKTMALYELCCTFCPSAYL